MTAQCSDPFCLGLPEWTTCCQENRSRANAATTSSELEGVAAVASDDKRFNSFLTADEAEKIAVGQRR